jgi:multiple sugar transport system ATP-binding protein
VTHDQIEAMTMADKIVVMRDGLVEQIGAPLDLYDRPANMFVAGFIGSPSMNFINGKIEEGSFVADGGFRLSLPQGDYASLSGKAVYGVRPEYMKIAEGGVPVTAEIVEPTGSEIMVMGKLGTQPITCLFRERLTVRPGDVLPIAIDPATSHVFEPEKGMRVSA